MFWRVAPSSNFLPLSSHQRYFFFSGCFGVDELAGPERGHGDAAVVPAGHGPRAGRGAAGQVGIVAGASKARRYGQCAQHHVGGQAPALQAVLCARQGLLYRRRLETLLPHRGLFTFFVFYVFFYPDACCSSTSPSCSSSCADDAAATLHEGAASQKQYSYWEAVWHCIVNPRCLSCFYPLIIFYAGSTCHHASFIILLPLIAEPYEVFFCLLCSVVTLIIIHPSTHCK